jgi:hypothetical protein
MKPSIGISRYISLTHFEFKLSLLGQKENFKLLLFLLTYTPDYLKI